MRVAQIIQLVFAMCCLFVFLPAKATIAPIAEYRFNNSFASSIAGAPDLSVTDPLGMSGFATDSVFGHTHQVFNFKGSRNSVLDQAGLTLDTTGLLTNNSDYSIQLIFKLTDPGFQFRRVIDVHDRQLDGGVYVGPSNRVGVYPESVGNAVFSENVYYDLFLTNAKGIVKIYINGLEDSDATTNAMNIGGGGHINFFLDNVVGGGQREYSSGSVALVRVYDEALNAPPVAEPETYAMLLAGLGLLGFMAGRKNDAMPIAAGAPKSQPKRIERS